MVSLAGYLCDLANRGTIDSEEIVRKYESWIIEEKYMVMVHEREQWVSEPVEWEYIAVKCAKRGNDVDFSAHTGTFRVRGRACLRPADLARVTRRQ